MTRLGSACPCVFAGDVLVLPCEAHRRQQERLGGDYCERCHGFTVDPKHDRCTSPECEADRYPDAS